MIPILDEVLGLVSKNIENTLKESEISGRSETKQTVSLIK